MRGPAQTRLLAEILTWRERELDRAGGRGSQGDIGSEFSGNLEDEWSERGFSAFGATTRGDLAGVRVLDVIAAINRLRPRLPEPER